MTDQLSQEIQSLEQEIFSLTQKLHGLYAEHEQGPVPNYTFYTQNGDTSLAALFGDNDKLLMIHNMGQGCRYCTLWADSFNGLLPHLEDAMSVVLVSKDDPETQRRFANSRGWGFRLASHRGSNYLAEQSAIPGAGNYPGAVVYIKQGDEIVRKNSCAFGPGDLYCSQWNLLALAGLTEADWTPQFNYWVRPDELDDGGENILG